MNREVDFFRIGRRTDPADAPGHSHCRNPFNNI
jgi:hypothetical protein